MRFALMLVTGLALLAFSAQSARADACRDAFMKVKTISKPAMASKSRIISLTQGQQPNTTHHFSNGAGDWMTQGVNQPNTPWSLEVGKVLYSSSDRGKTWKKERDMNDAGHDPEAVRKQVADASAAATNLICGSEEMDGLRHETFEADIAFPQMNMTTREKLWLHPETGRVVKAHTIMRTGGMEITTTQFIEYLSELTLPKP
jgi:hypothetical protein